MGYQNVYFSSYFIGYHNLYSCSYFIGYIYIFQLFHWLYIYFPAISLAINRDGSSGGVVRLAAITKDGVERFLLTGDQIPKFYEDS